MALREPQQRFRNAFQNAPIGMALVGLDGRFLDVNGALCQLLGYAPDQLSVITVQEVTHPLDAEALRDRKSTRLNSSHTGISYSVFCLKKNNIFTSCSFCGYMRCGERRHRRCESR